MLRKYWTKCKWC